MPSVSLRQSEMHGSDTMVRASALAPPVNPGAAGGFHQGPASAQSGGGFQGTAHEVQPMEVTNDAGGWWGLCRYQATV